MEFTHIPVLLDACLEGLAVKPDGIYVDATAGGGGHSSAIARRLENGRLFALDQDPDAVRAASLALADFPCAEVIHTNFSEMTGVLQLRGVHAVDGVLLDLGVSSHQLDTGERGFSYHVDAPLDMRMSQSGFSAAELVNTWDPGAIARILREYGEERFASSIARNIAKRREEKPIETTMELVDIIKASMPAKAKRDKNPAKRSFQAIRIAVNGELERLGEALCDAFELLNPGGRLAVITFHSLEDRIVKRQYAEWCRGCTCPADFPVCVCGNKPRAALVTRKPVTASQEELEENKRSRSARLRVIQKI